MKRIAVSRLLWGLALALVLLAIPLILFNSFYGATLGQNEEVGGVLAVTALVLGGAGLALRRPVLAPGKPDARIALAGVAAVALLLVSWFGVMALTAGGHGDLSVRTIEWTRLQETPEGAPRLPPDALPEDVWESLRRTAPGERSHAQLDAVRYEAFWQRLEFLQAPQHGCGSVALVDGAPFQFCRGAVP